MASNLSFFVIIFFAKGVDKLGLPKLYIRYLKTRQIREEPKIKILYHDPCPDGKAAAWVANKKYPEAEFIGVAYPPESEPFKGLPNSCCSEDLVLLDFSVLPVVIKKWRDQGCSVTVIDHHISAIQHLQSIKKQLKGKLDSSKCGALLTWEYYFPHKTPPSFLYLVNERDIGNVWKQPQDQYWGSNANIFYQWCHSAGRNFKLFDRLEKLSLDNISELTIGAKKELAEKREYCANLFPSIKIIDWEGYKTAYIELEKAVASDLGKMIVDTLDVDIALMFRDHYELRSSASKGTVDVSLIAKKYGGGGHRHAAGFSIQNKLDI